MTDYFKTFPLIEYDSSLSRNIILRAGVAKEIVERYGVFYPYRVKDHERLDTIAFDYYGDSKFSWLIALANGILDPYTDWPMCDEDFMAYIKDKYGSFEYAAATVHHYENEDPSITWWMSPETRSLLDPTDRIGHDVETTIWEWESQRNEDKKSIRLLSKRYAERALRELKTAFFIERG